jgi:hypothetical protein
MSSLLKRTRKKLLCGGKTVKKEEGLIKTRAKRGLLSQLTEDPPLETSLSSVFIEPTIKKTTQRTPKPPPSIVFTRLTRR